MNQWTVSLGSPMGSRWANFLFHRSVALVSRVVLQHLDLLQRFRLLRLRFHGRPGAARASWRSNLRSRPRCSPVTCTLRCPRGWLRWTGQADLGDHQGVVAGFVDWLIWWADQGDQDEEKCNRNGKWPSRGNWPLPANEPIDPHVGISGRIDFDFKVNPLPFRQIGVCKCKLTL